MTNGDNYLEDPGWQSFIVLRLLFLIGLTCLVILYFVLHSISSNNYIITFPLYGSTIWSYLGRMNEILLIAFLIALITFFIYYICSIQAIQSKYEKIFIFSGFSIAFSFFFIVFFPVSTFFIVGYTLLSFSILDFLSIFLVFGGINFYFVYTGLNISYKNQKNPSSLDEATDEHHAIILVNYQTLKLPVFGQGIDILLESFKEKNYSYKVYFCNDEISIKNVIINNKAVYLWIFGHGKKDALKLYNNEYLYYHQIDFTNVKKKLFIGQFHCNPCIGECRESLAELIGIYGYVTNDYRDTLKNRKEIQTLQNLRKFG